LLNGEISSDSNEDRYHFLINNCMDILGELNVNGTILYVNPYINNELGYNPVEIIGTNFIDLTHPDDAKMVIKVLNKWAKPNAIIPEIRIKSKNNDFSCFELKIKRFEEKNAQIRIIFSLKSIRRFKDIEEKIKQSKEGYKYLFNNSLNMIVLMNLSGNIIEVNKALLKFTGEKKSNIIGKNFKNFDKNYAGNFPLVIEKFKELLLKGTLKNFELQFYDKKNCLKWAHIQAFLIEIKSKTFIQLIIQDITERKLTEQKLIDSEEKYRGIIEAVPDLFFLIGKDGSYLEYKGNPNFLYTTPEVFLGKNLLNILPKKEANLFLDAIQETLESKNPRILEYSLSIKGKKIYFEARIFYFTADQAVLFIRDITNRKIIEEKLKESEEKYRNLIETSSMGLLEIDIKKGGIVYINPRLLGLIGYTLEEMRDENLVYNVIYPIKIDDIRKSPEDKNIEFRIINKEGKIIWLSGRTLHHYNTKGELTHLRLWLQDITERKELEEIKSNLLTRTSHEFKTPLISIKGFSDLLLAENRDKLDEKAVTFLEKVKEGADKLNLLINQFIESSELDKFLVKLNLTHENISNIIRDCILEMEGLIKLRNHEVNLLIHNELLNYIDKEKIHTVIANLLINAIKYTPRGGNITIQSKIKRQSILISIKDNGIGLQKEEISQIFQPFGKIERYGKGWDIISEGIGLGLHLSKEIIDLHGGKIWVKSEGQNKGSIFFLLLPIRKNEEI